ncbi:Cro/Cl family transcriptional regulator [Acidithiobacillus sp. MC2.1]|uniref:Prophage Afe01, transcriptional regulator, Cro family n=1 Tax=Acidithiobacillus ferrooxidans (strain ATCC 23270 / DSM 14882 / CIP 104768 / NCIMB 8455) TaxID=243159 RepID=B7J7H4_ACIF2|nr:prophage Afe01, transcriptional regulator, Cro family [Acidithiobacillus ferrooxidans ATCC 23270]MBN6745469.1 Cro/Cl family transcriptional regulator [Acidithiobacillus sp. MC2.2]MBN6748716.1 Cro/Cl family transcriptional regulator [Acidithiobacillus sp. PG05]
MDTKLIIKSLGGPTAVARLIGITKGAVSQWKAIPVDKAILIERATHGSITRQELRPDIFLPHVSDGDTS